MVRIFLATLFFLGAPTLLGVSLYMAQAVTQPSVLGAQTVSLPSVPYVFAALPPNMPEIKSHIISGDARTLIVAQFLEQYNAPLASSAAELVSAADTYGLDFRLLPAISMQESNGCKIIPHGSHNCWGWGIHSRGSLGFDSINEGIHTVAKGLSENYINQGLITPEEIMSKYTPSSPGTWSNAVRHFMEEME